MSQKTTKTTTPKSTMPKKSNKGQFAKGNTVGEQTRFEKENAAANKYKDEYCDMLIEFFNKPATRIEYKKNYVKGELSSETPIVLPAEYPTFELFAASIGVTTKTLQNWCESTPVFRTITHAQRKYNSERSRPALLWAYITRCTRNSRL